MKIVCLADSFRTGGRCLGGIELDKNNNPVFKGKRPNWVRPVWSAEHEEIPNAMAVDFSLLDIIEFDVLSTSAHDHHTENVFFKHNSIKKNGQFDIDDLDRLTDNDRFPLLFGNRGAAVVEDEVGEFDYSLTLIRVNTFETHEREFEGRAYPQKKISFQYNKVKYDLVITDPDFHRKYAINPNLLDDEEKIFITISLAAPHGGYSSKLVAGIIY